MTVEPAADVECADVASELNDGGATSGHGVIETAFCLLDHIGAMEPVRLSDLARVTGVPRPTAYRLLRQLIEVGAVRRDGKRYCLGASLLGLGSRVTPERRLRVAARRPIAELAAATGAAVNLTATIGGISVYLDATGATGPLPFVAEPGATVPSGTAEARANALFARSTPIVDAGGILPDLSCVAVPIGLGSGHCAAVSALFAGPRPPAELLVLTRMAAMRISGLLREAAPTSIRNPFSGNALG